MAVKVAQLIVEVTGDTRGLDRSLRDAERKAVGAATSIGKSFAGSAIGVGTLTAGLAIGGHALLSYSGRVEQLRISFATLAGSTQAAQAHLKQLQNLANATPFQFEELAQASRRMQALGFSLKEVVPLLRSVGEAVSAIGGSGETLDRVTLALSQMQAKNRVMTQEMNQLAEVGLPVWQILEQQLGKTRAELVKMIEAGEISSRTFLAAFQNFSRNNFAGSMERQSKTLLGSLSTLKDSALQLADKGFAPLTAKIRDASVAMAEFAVKQDSLGGMIGGFLAGRLKMTGQTFVDFFNPFSDQKSIARQMGEQLYSIVDSLAGVAKRAGSALKEYFNEGWGSVKLGPVSIPWPRSDIDVSQWTAGTGQGTTQMVGVPTIEEVEAQLGKVTESARKFTEEFEKIWPAKNFASDLASQLRTFGDDTSLTKAREYFRALREELNNLANFTPEAVAQFNAMERQALETARGLDVARKAAERAKEQQDFQTEAIKAAREAWVQASLGVQMFGKSEATVEAESLKLRTGLKHLADEEDRLDGVTAKKIGTYIEAARVLREQESVARSLSGEIENLWNSFGEEASAVERVNKLMDAYTSSVTDANGVVPVLSDHLAELFRQAERLARISDAMRAFEGLSGKLDIRPPTVGQGGVPSTAAGPVVDESGMPAPPRHSLRELVRGYIGSMNDIRTVWRDGLFDMVDAGAGIFTNFFTSIQDGWKGALTNMGLAFVQSLQQMAAQALASQVWGFIMNLAGSALGGAFAGGGGSLGSAAANAIGGYASGTFSARPGLALVGERGPELVGFGGGERVLNNEETRGLLGGGSKIEFHVHGVQSPAQFLAAETQNQIQRRLRRATQGDAMRRGTS